MDSGKSIEQIAEFVGVSVDELRELYEAAPEVGVSFRTSFGTDFAPHAFSRIEEIAKDNDFVDSDNDSHHDSIIHSYYFPDKEKAEGFKGELELLMKDPEMFENYDETNIGMPAIV